MKPCKYADGIEGEWECTCYGKIDCPYQDVDYNYIDFTTGHKEINVVSCTKTERNGEMTDKEKEINTKVRNARLILHNIMRDADTKWLYDHLVDVDRELFEIRDMLVEDENADND